MGKDNINSKKSWFVYVEVGFVWQLPTATMKWCEDNKVDEYRVKESSKVVVDMSSPQKRQNCHWQFEVEQSIRALQKFMQKFRNSSTQNHFSHNNSTLHKTEYFLY